MSNTLDYDTLMRRAIDVAKAAHAAGNHPFGALLVDSDGKVLMEQGNIFGAEGDATGHAERVLMTRASKAYDGAFLETCTMVTSAEPCAMCAGSVYWAGVGRIVFGMRERDLKDMIGPHPDNLTLDLPCTTVFAAGQRKIEVIGPVLEAEAAAIHEGAWT